MNKDYQKYQTEIKDLKEERNKEIRNLRKQRFTFAQIGEAFGISHTLVMKICKGTEPNTKI